MVRGSILVRDAVPEDAHALMEIWQDFTSGAKHRVECELRDVEQSVMRLETEPSERLVVAVADQRPIGVAHLRRAAISPIHGEDAVHVGYLHVLSGHRRRGVGKALLETAVDWADEKDTPNVVAVVGAHIRDANRFLARLGMSQVAVVRATTVLGLRAKLAGAPGRSVTSAVVKARRLTRRSTSPV